MTFEEMYALACQRKKEMPEGKGTTELFKKGPHAIGPNRADFSCLNKFRQMKKEFYFL